MVISSMVNLLADSGIVPSCCSASAFVGNQTHIIFVHDQLNHIYKTWSQGHPAQIEGNTNKFHPRLTFSKTLA
eukprot:6374170-Amphidinium_carterae.1